ncbi:MAG: DUF1800 domain-containing protein [Acidobacteria bacterium]|nr:DUF1800 domain-containing protein [Acidobacteriota bacterium]
MKRSIPIVKQACTGIILAAFCAPLFIINAGPAADKKLTEEQKILHVLNRLGFGARPGDIEKVKAMGIQKYIDQQLDPSSIADTVAEKKVENLEIFKMSTDEVFAKYPNPGALLRQLEGNMPAQAAEEMTDKQRQDRQQKLRSYYQKYDLRPAGQLQPQIIANRVLRDVYSERQLQEVMVDFWQNHFNVFAGKAAVRWYIPSYERDVIRKNALGNFRDLLLGTAQHPAMLFYLDNFESVAPSGQTAADARPGRLQRLVQEGGVTPRIREQMKRQQGLTDAELDQRIARIKTGAQNQQNRAKRGLNENYARELMELHTMGVDSGYTQKDIVEVARAFTGWTIADPRGYRRIAAAEIKGTDDNRIARLQRMPGVPDDIESGQFYFNDRWHDNGTKTVLGQKVDEGGIKDGLKVIDILVKSPATAKFIARKLCVKFVNDNPDDAIVNRVAAAFSRSNGDIRSTLRAIFTDKEFFAPENYRAKIKTPFELAISAIRTIGADTTASPAVVAMLNKLGEVPYGYQAPTGYPDTAEDWVNTGALLERLNFTVALAANQIPGTRVDLKRFDAPDKAAMLNKAIAVVLDNDISPATRATLLKQVEQPLPEAKVPPEVDDEAGEPATRRPAGQPGGQNRQARLLAPSGKPEIFKVVSLVLGTPEFQRQ